MRYRTRTITGNPHRRKSATNGAQQTPWSFGEIKRSIDRHPAGTHAGLEHIQIALLHGATVVGVCDVHLHHNRKGLSVGTTTIVFTNNAALQSQG